MHTGSAHSSLLILSYCCLFELGALKNKVLLDTKTAINDNYNIFL